MRSSSIEELAEGGGTAIGFGCWLQPAAVSGTRTSNQSRMSLIVRLCDARSFARASQELLDLFPQERKRVTQTGDGMNDFRKTRCGSVRGCAL